MSDPILRFSNSVAPAPSPVDPRQDFYLNDASKSAGKRIVRVLTTLSLIYSGFSFSATVHAAELAQGSQAEQHATREIRGLEKSLTRGATLPGWVDTAVTAPAATSQDPLVVRLSDVQLYVDKDPVIYVHRMAQVNDASMLTSVGKIEIFFQPEYQQVTLHALHVIRGNNVIDKTNSADIRFLQREQGLEEGVYTGSVTASVVVDDIRVGDTVDISYSVTGNNPVFAGKFFQSVAWDSGFPTLRKRITLNAPEDRSIYYRILGQGNGVQVKESKSGPRKITRFMADNVAQIDYEPYAPTDVDQVKQIQFSEFRSWQQVAQWAGTLFKVDTPATGVEEVTAKMLGVPDADTTVQKALEYVQNNIRYLSISLGENSHKPFPPDLVLARRYGDCKDKALLLVTILRQLGIEASPVLVSTYSHKGLDRLLPTPLAFGHAIVRAVVKGKVYFLDPTRSAQYGMLENMGQAHGGAEVLVVQDNTNGLTTIPSVISGAPVSNSRIERVAISKPEGPADMTVIHRYSGLEAEGARYYLARQTQDQLRKQYAGSMIRRYPNAEMISGPIVSDNKQANTLSIEMHYRIPAFLEKNETGWQVRYQASNMRERFYLPENPRRNYALAIPVEPVSSHYDFELILPEQFDAKYNPTERSINDVAFGAKETLSFTGRVMHVSLDLNMLGDRVPAKDVSNFMVDTRKLGTMLDSSLQIRKSDLKTDNLKLLLDTPLKQRLAEQQEELVNSKTRSINEARNTGQATADALCERGLAYAHLGKKMDALTDIQAAMKERPTSNELLQCRAEIALFNGDMKSSEADYARVIAQGVHDGKTYLQLATAYYAQEKWQAAADGYALAYENSADPQDKIRASIMRAICVRKLNPRVRTSNQSSDQGDWTGVMLAAVEGIRNEDDVLREIHHRTGDDLEFALGDVYFYLGQLNLLAGNRLKASVYLQRSLDKGILSSAYRPAARLEIDRLRR